MEDLLKSQLEVQHMQSKLKEYEKLMEETSRSWEERLKITEDRKIEEAEQLKVGGAWWGERGGEMGGTRWSRCACLYLHNYNC